MNGSEVETAKKLFLLLLLNMIITVSTMVFRAIINSYERYFFLKGLETVQLVLQPVLIFLLIQSFPSSIAIGIVQTLVNIVLALVRCIYCFFVLRIKIKFHYWDKELFNDFKKLALSVFLVTIIDQVFFKTNQIILGIISGTAAVAVYSLSSLIYMNYLALSVAISGVYLPHITEMIAKGNSIMKLSQLFIRVGRWQFYLLSLVASGFIIFGRQFICIWAGRGFEDAYWITILIIIPFTIDLIQNIGLSILQAQNKYDFRAKVYLCMGILNICLALPLGLKYGGIGCAFATGLAMFIGNGLIMNWYYAKVTKLDISNFWRQIGKIAFFVVLTMSISYTANVVLYTDNIFIFLLKILIYTCLYCVVLFKYCLNFEEKEKVKKFSLFTF